jgi:hypothetical protein
VTKVEQIQKILEVTPDGIWGPKTQAALDLAVGSARILRAPPDILSGGTTQHHVMASSFADPKDLASFQKWRRIFLERGFSEEEATRRAFAYGDNAIGCWDDDTARGSGPSVALPPDDMIEAWGSVDAAKHKPVQVVTNGKWVCCILKDRMPWRKDITNGAGIDLNFDALAAVDLEPPILKPAIWYWV